MSLCIKNDFIRGGFISPLTSKNMKEPYLKPLWSSRIDSLHLPFLSIGDLKGDRYDIQFLTNITRRQSNQ